MSAIRSLSLIIVLSAVLMAVVLLLALKQPLVFPDDTPVPEEGAR